MNNTDTNLLFRIATTLIPGVGDIVGKKLISYCGGPEAVFRESRQALLQIPGISRNIVDEIINHKCFYRAEEEMLFIDKHKIRPLFYTEKEYPERLKHCIDSPIMLYYKGNTDLNNARVIAIVGTRKITDYGRSVVKQMVCGLKEFDVLIISGLAYGVDTVAHRETLEAGLDTVGVLAHGLDRLYPSSNRTLAEKMTKQGGLLTDFMSKTNPDRENFPKRNRIVAGMCDAVIVVESAKRGGALITADIANSYNRDVFSVPGNIGEKYSEGCNFLIRTNRAALVQSPEDLIYLMGWEDSVKSGPRQKKLFIQLSPDENKLVELLNQYGQMRIDKLCVHAKIPPTKVASALLNLEFNGVIKCLPGKVYQLS